MAAPPPLRPSGNVTGEQDAGYVRVVADEAAGSMQNAFWAFTIGFFAHGTGHYLAGDRKLALTLLGIEAAGVLLWAGGFLAEELSGGSAQVLAFTRPVEALGALAFVSSWQLDLLGTFSGRAGTARYEEPPPDPLVGTAWYTLWSDSRQGHLNLFTLGLQLPAGRLLHLLERVGLGAEATWDPFATSDPLLLSGRTSIRLLGGNEELASRLTLDLEWVEELRTDQGYGVSTPVASLEARYNLQGVLPRFRSVVLLGRWGYGLEAMHYGASSRSFDLQGDRYWVTVGEMGIILPLVRVGRMDLRWRLVNDRLLSAGQPGRAPYHVGFHFQIGSLMDLLLSLNMGMGFDGWIGMAYRYY
ncbi:MAG: hypothetical protein FJ125_05795 [Deltaproteobacteria bacterium]|nr:hypothetical protein [Deltaproteobacteria bacterium]